MKVDGITLLQMIRNKEIKDNTKIKEHYLNIPTKNILEVTTDNLVWKPGEFLVRELWDKDYSFEILEEKPKEILQKIDFSRTSTQKEKNRLIKDTVNQIIDYLLKKEDDK